jgi:hypothetical protein
VKKTALSINSREKRGAAASQRQSEHQHSERERLPFWTGAIIVEMLIANYRCALL